MHFRVGTLEHQMRERQLDARDTRLRISTTDRPQSRSSDFRIPFGSTNTHEFTHLLFKFGATVEESLLSDWSPRDEITKFEEFRIRPGTNDMLWIIVRLKPGVSVDMSFDALALGR